MSISSVRPSDRLEASIPPAVSSQKGLKVAIAIFAMAAVVLAVAAPFTASVLVIPAFLCALIALNLSSVIRKPKEESFAEDPSKTSAEIIDEINREADSIVAEHRRANLHRTLAEAEVRRESLPPLDLSGVIAAQDQIDNFAVTQAAKTAKMQADSRELVANAAEARRAAKNDLPPTE